ncbi:hypothetical protein HWV62_7726 [Athelia sp. TMB]|nr:hypothetical protein HWV62_7726 [Athelia sp. TMB]
MASVTSMPSPSSLVSYLVPPSPIGSNASASSSNASFRSLGADDDGELHGFFELTSNLTLQKKTSQSPLVDLCSLQRREAKSSDLQLLGISTHITELSYSISDIQTRIFEIQELRHKSQSSNDATGTTNIIDQALMHLDEKLEAVTAGMKVANELVQPLMQSPTTPTFAQNSESGERGLLLRKHATLVAEWESVQDESDVLREELKEDKWLTVFRTVTEQADGMMSSLEKAVNRCQDFIWQVHRRGPDELGSYPAPDKSPLNIEVFNSLLESFEAKKKHYMPATSKVLSIIDKGVQDRVTKNGETLRRHAESAKRWKTLKDRIARADSEMASVRTILLSGDGGISESGSTTSITTVSTKNGYLDTPPSMSRSASQAPSTRSTMSSTISPLRKFARKIAGRPSAPVTPAAMTQAVKAPSSDPIGSKTRQRQSLFGFRGSQPAPLTPERPSHKHSHSMTPETSPSRRADADSTIKGRPGVSKQKWNSSTKVSSDDRTTITSKTLSRRASAMNLRDDIPPVPPLSDYMRSVSRSSMASSGVWSPNMSSASTAATSHPSIAISPPRPPSRSYTPSRARTPSRSYTPGLGTTPRARAKTPSNIPGPSTYLRSFSGSASSTSCDDDENGTTMMQRAVPGGSPGHRAKTPSGSRIPPPRPPSRSMIPLPNFTYSTPSRPSTAMSDYGRPESRTSSSFMGSMMRAQTPESAMQARTQALPFYQGSGGGRPSMRGLPPSSFRDNSTVRTPSGVSRPGSRAGAFTPYNDPVHEYISTNTKDPLDQEVATIVNSIPHGLLVERVDPPLKTAPRAGEEIRAQYAFSNALSRKIVTCKLTTLTRSGSKDVGKSTTTKKVMCRVGGGWQDLQLYMLNRQAGM